MIDFGDMTDLTCQITKWRQIDRTTLSVGCPKEGPRIRISPDNSQSRKIHTPNDRLLALGPMWNASGREEIAKMVLLPQKSVTCSVGFRLEGPR